MAGLSAAGVVLAVVLGFSQLGAPSTQREFRADQQRVRELFQLSTEVKSYWTTHASQLPASIDQFSVRTYTDPINHAPYEYHPKQGSQYELCAVFTRSSEASPSPDPWTHPAGRHCFPLDASGIVRFPQPYPQD